MPHEGDDRRLAALERNNKKNEITDWLVYFAETALEAQRNTLKRVDFYVAKAKLYERLHGQLNERQQRATARMFREGIDGFKGGSLLKITSASRALRARRPRGTSRTSSRKER